MLRSRLSSIRSLPWCPVSAAHPSSLSSFHSHFHSKSFRSHISSPIFIPFPLSHFRSFSSVSSSFSSPSHDEDTFSPSSSPSSSSPPSSSRVFVSSHFRLSPDDLFSYLNRKGLYFRDSPTHAIIRDCPFCPPIKGKSDNQYKLYVERNSGAHFCHRCQSKGSWFDLKKKMGDLGEITSNMKEMGRKYQSQYGNYSNEKIKENIHAMEREYGSEQNTKSSSNVTSSPSSVSSPSPSLSPSSSSPQTPRHSPSAPSQSFLHTSRLSLSSFPKLTNWLTEDRKIRLDIAEKYGVGGGKYKFLDDNNDLIEEECITFPWTEPIVINPNDSPTPPSTLTYPYRIVRLKIRSHINKSHMRLTPVPGQWGFFGWHTIPPTADSIVITEGEFDAMAVHQSTGMPTISLPNGAGSLPVDLLPLLERFKFIYLWLDDDSAGQSGAEKFAQKLGVGRCLIVKTRGGASDGPKDANDAMREGKDLGEILDKAEPLPHEQIATFCEIRQEVYREFSEPRARLGVQSSSLPSLNKILKGHRRGELTVITGATGVGKTTVLSQISLDFCAQGVNTLWGSFEIKNSRLARTQLTQYSGMDFSKVDNLPLFPLWADKFESLPMFYMRFFGSSSVDSVLDAMEYAVYMHDIEHIVLDNLQFMLSGQQRNSMDKFDMQDRAIDAFRSFATKKNVHITLVIHPRKEQENMPLGVSSVFGSAKATQEADNVIIIQAAVSPVNSAPSFQSYNGRGNYEQNGGVRYGFIPSPHDEFRRLEIKKNRFDGTLGIIPFKYERETGRIVEVSVENEEDKKGEGKSAVSSPSSPVNIIRQPFVYSVPLKEKKRGGRQKISTIVKQINEQTVTSSPSSSPPTSPSPLLTSAFSSNSSEISTDISSSDLPAIHFITQNKSKFSPPSPSLPSSPSPSPSPSSSSSPSTLNSTSLTNGSVSITLNPLIKNVNSLDVSGLKTEELSVSLLVRENGINENDGNTKAKDFSSTKKKISKFKTKAKDSAAALEKGDSSPSLSLTSDSSPLPTSVPSPSIHSDTNEDDHNTNASSETPKRRGRPKKIDAFVIDK